MKLLLISNSTNPGEVYLGWPRSHIKAFYEKHQAREILFVPYAGVNLSDMGLETSFNIYEEKVSSVFIELGLSIRSIHREQDPVKAVRDAKAIAVGGGNTFHLVYMLHKLGLMEVIREKVIGGMPYAGWSAGANIACPTLRTTNDMPIIQPKSFHCLDLIPFQINPHYLDVHPEGHGGETREQRILEFLAINPNLYVVGLREACYLEMDGSNLQLHGRHPMRIFRQDTETREHKPGSDLAFLLEKA